MLRPLNSADIEFLYRTENDPENWSVSDFVHPYSWDVLQRYVNSLNEENLYTERQVRFVICESETNPSPKGLVDLYDVDLINRRAGVGIVVDPECRRQAWAQEALKEVAHFANTRLNLHQLYAYVREERVASVRLFEKLEYEHITTLPEWLCEGGEYRAIYLYRKVLDATPK